VPRGCRTIAVVGRLHWQKGLDWLLSSMPRIFSSFPDARLLVVGHGPDQSRLTDLARELQVSDRVHFLGWREDVPRILAGSEMLILPSRWEGMPNVVLEAMATGLPVVATRAEGVCELLGQDEPAQFVDFGSAEQLFDRVTRVLSNPEWGRELGRRNRHRAGALFSLELMVERYQDLYTELLRT